MHDSDYDFDYDYEDAMQPETPVKPGLLVLHQIRAEYVIHAARH